MNEYRRDVIEKLRSPSGERARDALHRALGRGLAHWQFVETALFLVTFGAMRAPFGTCSREFFKRKIAGRKVEFTDRRLKSILDTETYDRRWLPLKTELDELVSFRNSLAHWEVVATLSQEGSYEGQDPTLSISTHHLDVNAGENGLVRSMTTQQIQSNARQLSDMAYRLLHFMIDIVPVSAEFAATLPSGTREWLQAFVGSSHRDSHER